jgi:EAL domain-containing protein (putative c-di-GMP-specific phosphodiesterase class I)
VETNEQLAFLQLRECDNMQGFLFSKPVNGNALKQLLQSGKNLSNATP